jgi:hypothetical protein
MVNLISDIAASEYNIELMKEARLDIVENVLSHYHDHIMAYDISVTGSDPYKFLAWAGVYIYETLYKSDREFAIKFLSASIAALHRMLIETGKSSLPEWFLRKSLLMVISEYNSKPHLGLGRNGLYMTFKAAAF